MDAFLAQHARDYRERSILSERPGLHAARTARPLRPPWLALGRRFWRGWLDRRVQGLRARAHAPGAARDFVWLGGLFGFPVHNRQRFHELRWARRHSRRAVLYFVDAADDFARAPNAARLARLIARSRSWVAVRSAEGAEILRHAGLRVPLRVGIDPVLYQRARERGLPFPRSAPPDTSLAIVPCNARIQDRLRPLWLAAGRAALQRGLAVHWVSCCDGEDLGLCEELREALRERLPQGEQAVVPARDAERALSAATACVASRFHGVIFGLSHGLATLAVPYCAKVRRLFRWLGLDDWLLEPVDPEMRWWEPSAASERVEALLGSGWGFDPAPLRRGVEEHRRIVAAFRETLG